MPTSLGDISLIGLRCITLILITLLFLYMFPDVATEFLPSTIVHTGVDVAEYIITFTEMIPRHAQLAIETLYESFMTFQEAVYAEYPTAMMSTGGWIFQLCKRMIVTPSMLALRFFNIAMDELIDPQYLVVVKTVVSGAILTFLCGITYRLCVGI